MIDVNEQRDPVERLLEELLERRRRGELPTIDEYVGRLPECEDRIRKEFPIAIALEDAVMTGSMPSRYRDGGSEAGPPAKLGRFEVVNKLGEGGMGVVYKAFDPSTERMVAIKLLKPALVADPRARKRFLGEAKAAASIKCDHVAVIHEVSEFTNEENGASQPAIVMEYVEGKSLKARTAEGPPLQVCEILRIGRQIALGLASAHQQGVVHRDIKPANILLENGVERAKITDFGLALRATAGVARHDVAETRLTQSNELLGTYQYMSPEQTRNGNIDHRSDLFSFGCVLYEMCTGVPPFGASGDILKTIHRIQYGRPAAIRLANPDVPDWLTAIVARLLKKKPSRRPQSAAEVAEELTRYLAILQDGRSTPAVRWVSWRRAIAIAGGLVLTAIVVTIIVMSAHRGNLDSRGVDQVRQKETSGGPTKGSSGPLPGEPWNTAAIENRGGRITNQAVEFLQCALSEVDEELSQALRRLTGLYAVSFLDCNLTRLDGLHDVENFTFLWLESCPSLGTLEGLERTRFRRVQIGNCNALNDVAGVRLLQDLEVLELRHCDRLADLSELKHLPRLEQLYIEACPRIRDFRWLRDLPHLRILYVNACPGLANTDDFAGLLEAQELDLAHCQNLTDLRGLAPLIRLRSLNLVGCTGLSEQAVAALRAAIPEAQIKSE